MAINGNVHEIGPAEPPAMLESQEQLVAFDLRAGTRDDWAFVIDGWRFGNLAVGGRGMARDDYFNEITPRIVAALERGARVKLAHDAENANVLLGFAVLEQVGDELALHYIRVRRDFRGQGIARALLKGEAVSVFTHRPRERKDRDGKPIPFQPPKGWRFNPWAFVPMTKGT